MQVWDALEHLPAPDKLQKAGHLQNQQLKPHTAALSSLACCAGLPLNPSAVAKVVLQVGRLRQWQQHSTDGSSMAARSLSQQMAAASDLLAEEFGSTLDICMQDGPEALAWFIGSSSSSMSDVNAAAAAAAAAEGVAAATPVELRQMFAAGAAADDLGWGGDSSSTAAAAAAGQDDVDIDSDDERKGRGKKVRGAAVLARMAAAEVS